MSCSYECSIPTCVSVVVGIGVVGMVVVGVMVVGMVVVSVMVVGMVVVVWW